MIAENSELVETLYWCNVCLFDVTNVPHLKLVILGNPTPIEDFHFCSAECLETWAHKQAEEL